MARSVQFLIPASESYAPSHVIRIRVGHVKLEKGSSKKNGGGVFWSASPTGVKVLRMKFWPILFINTIWFIVYPKQYLCSWLRLGQEIYLLRLTYGFSSGESHTAGRVRKCQARRRSFKLGSFWGQPVASNLGHFNMPHTKTRSSKHECSIGSNNHLRSRDIFRS